MITRDKIMDTLDQSSVNAVADDLMALITEQDEQYQELVEALEDMTGRFERCCRYTDSADEETIAEITKPIRELIAKAKRDGSIRLSHAVQPFLPLKPSASSKLFLAADRADTPMFKHTLTELAKEVLQLEAKVNE